MKMILQFLNPWLWLRRRTGGRCVTKQGNGVGNAGASPEALRLPSSLTSPRAPKDVDALMSAARDRLTQLRASAQTRHRPEAVVPPTVFDESVFDEFTMQHGGAAQQPPDGELRTVLLPRDEAYAATIYLPRTDASAATAGSR